MHTPYQPTTDPMKITSAEFIKSTLEPEQYPRDRKPEIAFVGRSNVGKSSLLNKLLGRKGLAKTSGTPGKTQTLNYFLINNAVYFVDLPGYGYAKVPKALKDQWNEVMVAYLQDRPPLKLVVSLMDSRHKPSENDLQMLDILAEAEKPTIIVATKVDKLGQQAREKNLAMIHEALRLDEDSLVLPFSSETGEGVKDLWGVIEDVLKS
jgi:GTP-binding protein